MSPVLEPRLRLLQCNNGSDHGLFDAASPGGRGNGQRRRSFSFRDGSLAFGHRFDRRRLRRHRNEPDLRLPRSRPRRQRPRRPASEAAVFGVLSLIFWSLILVVTVKYVLILIRADNNGEGGTLALMALAQRAFKGVNRTDPHPRRDRGSPLLRRCGDHPGALGALRRRRPGGGRALPDGIRSAADVWRFCWRSSWFSRAVPLGWRLFSARSPRSGSW